MDNNNSLIPLKDAVETIKTAIMQGQYEALKDVNRVQLAVYYAIGRYLSKNTRKGVWGTGVLRQISDQLLREMPGLRGFSENSLKNMRKFYEAWTMLDINGATNVQTTDDQSSENSTIAIVENKEANSTITIVELQNANNVIDIYHSIQIPNIAEFPVEDFFNVPFTHHIRLIEKTKDISARYYYIHRIVEEKLSVDALEKLIKRHAYENKDTLPNNFLQTMPNSSMARKAVMMFKDSYALEFINTEEIGERDAQDVDERVVEQRIVQNIKNFIMTFGNDFSFVGNQYHLEVYGENFFPDLIFFNRELNALVVVELKTGKFKNSYLGQLMGYLQILDDKVRKPHENPSIGIVLCKSANQAYVEYVIKEYGKPMGVATYKTADDMPENLRKALPDENKLKKLLEGESEQQ